MTTKRRPCIIGGLCCCYTACDCNEITCLCHGMKNRTPKCQVLCFRKGRPSTETKDFLTTRLACLFLSFIESGDCLCMRSSSCCATGVQHKGCGCTADNNKGECCMTSCFCCNCGLVTPKGTYTIKQTYLWHIMKKNSHSTDWFFMSWPSDLC